MKMIFVFAALLLAACFAAEALPKNEYPNPQCRRSEWLNLNGTWDFAETDDDNATYLNGEEYPDKIIVPFCRESSLSGLNRKGFVRNVWYRRTFTVPKDWKSERIRLHIGACDYRTTVWVNGIKVAAHTGSSAPIITDITDVLSDTNTLIVHAYDDVRTGEQPAGKQSERQESFGCFYTRVTGIWQTGWLEGVGSSYIERFVVNTDIDDGTVTVKPVLKINDPSLTFKAAAFAGSKTVASGEDKADWRNTTLRLNIDKPRLWSVDDPYLYELKLVLKDKEGNAVDTVYSYFGMREVTIDGAAILINHKPVFQRLVLDQGYYPDGVWTSPTDEALVKDIKLSKDAGFNGARLHQKVFEPRFLYHADKMGYLVWGEYPNWGYSAWDKQGSIKLTPEGHLAFIDDWRMVVERDINHPSIIGWCAFNEAAPETVPLQNTVMNITRDMDPTRPIVDSSGRTHDFDQVEVFDLHKYDRLPEHLEMFIDVGRPYMPGRTGSPKAMPFFNSEYGGIAWSEDDEGWGYGDTPKTKEVFYGDLKGATDIMLRDRYSFGYCYTQLYDVEQERNGIYFYDRTPKFDMKRIREIFSAPAVYEADPPTQGNAGTDKDCAVLVGTAMNRDMRTLRSYTFDKPGEDWTKPDFDDSAWKKGFGMFASVSHRDYIMDTVWNAPEIYLRQKFNYDGSPFMLGELILICRENPEIYVNGVKIFEMKGEVTHYTVFDVTKALKSALKPGENTVALRATEPEIYSAADFGLVITK